ncbi:hypothetical protein K505DRAFT_235220 [Melanomma pulvis-pyrius CBS 109.77]|uniref:Allergen n=1 Tax=Melanomma pulvis-pyrius CBS 109.77 TaxID=1314802 RepID=A0A6A6XM53_9PLEO|nr:hypothetical protein K505DRAFT_235220 [Melanomma pulvis-pyrius CBS 109.77]
MEAAKNSVKSFMAKAGHHDTTVHESVSPAVQHETIKPHHHENVTTATDREVHQDHYHRTVQPVHDREVLPEQHTHNLGAVQHKEFDHRDHEGVKQKLATEAQGFKDQRTVHDTHHTQSAAPAVAGEHVHHHIHETIQPVVHKETIQPNVVHTTVPIHEVHHNAATHHNTTELPAVSMSQFTSKGGALGGREERYDGFEGEPKNIGGVLGAGHSTGHEHSSHTHDKHDSHHTTGTGAGLTGTTGHAERTGLTGSSHHAGQTNQAGNLTREADRHHNGLGGTGTGATGSAVQGERLGRRAEEHALKGNNQQATTGTKPSMLKKLNPFADADGDGKKGLLD